MGGYKTNECSEINSNVVFTFHCRRNGQGCAQSLARSLSLYSFVLEMDEWSHLVDIVFVVAIRIANFELFSPLKSTTFARCGGKWLKHYKLLLPID